MNNGIDTSIIHTTIVAGNNAEQVVTTAVDTWFAASAFQPTAQPIVIAVPNGELARSPQGAPHQIARMLHDRSLSVRIVAPPTTLGGTFLSLRGKTHWIPTSVSSHATWLDQAWIWAPLAAPATSLILVNTFSWHRQTTSPVIGVWVHFVHPQQRALAAITDRRDGITADIASAVHPALVVLVTEHAGTTIALASADQIAAELIARALQTLNDPEPDAELALGPWEDALIQRATELDIGVRWPGPLQLHAIWTGNSDPSNAESFRTIVEHIRSRLDIMRPVEYHTPIS